MITKRTSLTVLVASVLSMLGLSGMFASQAAAVNYDPSQCTANATYDPSIPTPESVFGTVLAPNTGGNNTTNNAAKKNTPILYPYLTALANAAPEMVEKRSAGSTAQGKDIPFAIISSPSNMDDLEDDAAYWRGVRDGDISADDAKTQVSQRPAFAWISSNVHGDESSSAEATIKLMYELAARRDCANYDRLEKLTSFLLPVQNPDGRDDYRRTNGWLFDLNRDWATQEHQESFEKMSAALEYPSVVYVDAHQQGGSQFFFPPNEDPVHHEISDAAMNAINFVYGPALQKRFNDQNIAYRNYNAYDLFTPEYGDTVPALLLGAAGMTYEKGREGTYAKQVYDHYLSLDETLNTTARLKTRLLTDWVDQWQEAADEGANGELEPNQIVSPAHTISWNVPNLKVYGYFFKPNNHDGDTAKMITKLQRVGVKVYELGEDISVPGYHVFGDMTVNNLADLGPGRQTPKSTTQVMKAGTLYIPMAQTMKHWIQALLGEDGYVAYPYFYDVTGWSFSLVKGMSGNGYLTQPLPVDAQLTQIGAPDLGGAPASARPYYAFSTDSSQALIMLFKLADQGVKAYRTTSSFVIGGKTYPSGTAILDGSTVGSIDLESYSDLYQTPIAGFSVLPNVNRYLIKDPKIAMLSGTSTVTYPPAAACNGGSNFCAAYYTMTRKMGLPVTAINTTQLGSGELINGNYTAVVNPGTTVAAGVGATALQTFINSGGSYFAWGQGGVNSARNAGVTNVNYSGSNGTTDGVPVKVDFNTNSPLSWGFDNGGFLYRVSGATTLTPASLTAVTPNPSASTAVAAASYPNPTLRFSYATATGMNNLNGQVAATDQGFGAGRVTLLSVDPTFRAWLDGHERIIMNGVLYPTGTVLSPAAHRQPIIVPAGAIAPGEGEKLNRGELPTTRNLPAVKVHDPGDDLQVKVAAKNGKKLKKIFRSVAPKKIRKQARFVRKNGTVTLTVVGAASSDGHFTPWVQNLMSKINNQKVHTLLLRL